MLGVLGQRIEHAHGNDRVELQLARAKHLAHPDSRVQPRRKARRRPAHDEPRLRRVAVRRRRTLDRAVLQQQVDDAQVGQIGRRQIS